MLLGLWHHRHVGPTVVFPSGLFREDSIPNTSCPPKRMMTSYIQLWTSTIEVNDKMKAYGHLPSQLSTKSCCRVRTTYGALRLPSLGTSEKTASKLEVVYCILHWDPLLQPVQAMSLIILCVCCSSHETWMDKKPLTNFPNQTTGSHGRIRPGVSLYEARRFRYWMWVERFLKFHATKIPRATVLYFALFHCVFWHCFSRVNLLIQQPCYLLLNLWTLMFYMI